MKIFVLVGPLPGFEKLLQDAGGVTGFCDAVNQFNAESSLECQLKFEN